MTNYQITINSFIHSASKCCGQSYELYAEFFTNKVDSFIRDLPDSEKQIALNYAKQTGDYVKNYVNGDNECIHHFDYDTCPLGCGSLDREGDVAEHFECKHGIYRYDCKHGCGHF